MSQSISLSPRQLAWLLASITAITPFAIDVYLPAVPSMAEQFSVSTASVQQNLSIFLVGQAIGLLIGGSLSDIYGRKPILLIGLAIFAISSLIISQINQLEYFLIMRGVQAIGGGMLAVMSGAIVRDYYSGDEFTRIMALISLIMMTAPLTAPSIGSILNEWFGWQSIFIFLAIYTIFVTVLQCKFLPYHRFSETVNWQRFIPDIIDRYRTVFRTRLALGFLFIQSFSFANMFCFLTESPFIYMQYFGLSEHHYAWLFASNLFIMMCLNRIAVWKLKRKTPSQQILAFGVTVQWLINTSLLLLVCFTDIPFWLFATLVACSVGSQGLIGPNTHSNFMHFFKPLGGSASAILLSAQAIIAGSIGYLVTLLHNGTLMIMPIMMFFCTTIGAFLLWYCSASLWGEHRHLLQEQGQ